MVVDFSPNLMLAVLIEVVSIEKRESISPLKWFAFYLISGIYVGFANLPNQVHRKSVKRGFEFTLMVRDIQ